MKLVEQTEHSECGLACAAMILNYEGVSISLNEMRDMFGVPRGGMSLNHLVRLMNNYGINCKAYEILDVDSLYTINAPFICLWEKNHYVTVKSVGRNKVMIFDPAVGKRKISFAEFRQSFGGYILVVDKVEFLYKCNKPRNILLDKIKCFTLNKKIKFFFLFLVMILIQMNNLVMPILMQQFIDGGDRLSVFSNIVVASVFLILIFVCTYIIESLRGNLINEMQFQFNRELTYIFIEKIVGLDFKHFINRSSGDWIYRARLVEYIQQLLSPSLLFYIVDMLFAVIYFCLMLHYNVLLTLVVVAISIFFVCVSTLNTKILFNMNAKELILQSKLQNVVVEFFEGIETIKSLKMEERFGEKWKDTFFEQQNVSYKKNKISILFNGITSGGIIVYPLVIALLGYNMVNCDLISAGTVVAFLSLAQLFLQPLLNILSTIVQYVMIKIYLERINEILAIDNSEKCGEKNIGNDIQGIAVENVFFRYSAFEPDILKGVCIDLKAKQKIAIVGLNGSGKSTLLKCIGGLLYPTQGKISINDVSINEIASNDLRSKISYINQEPVIFNASLRENTSVYNFINDRLVDESAVLRPLSWHLILYVFRYFSRKWQKISDCECPDLIQNETPVRFL
ncbi:peptidase domain-containing ABC transporter, partial [Blautia sp. HCP3S3_D9]|uniref:peptidase domain-containing ABC transporter n=1 Tax=Blautia sp. HCP3S3_D9 TaxID=3438912 RepID=UPI003F8B4DA2